MADVEAPRRDDLSAMVREANAGDGSSYRSLARRAIDPETEQQLSTPWINNLARNLIKSAPAPWQLRALAVALGKPLSVVQRAAARQFLEYEAKELSGYSDDVRVVASYLAGMTDAEVRQYRAMIEASERVKHEGQ
ncbi:hypothetical protein [Streptacidiphilus albus]|uniref:hypothetical protein n=1 Tax=Streptacidiphilus albus TaxID=105425 RepID=UPI0005A7E04B|nr:hypothetical protein [Streptacidiphilus albus]